MSLLCLSLNKCTDHLLVKSLLNKMINEMKHRLLLLLFCFNAIVLIGQQTLPIPPAITGSEINLTLQKGTHQFFPGYNTNTLGVNGNILGPTIILEKGQVVMLNVSNQIGEETTIHWHGLHVSSANDGGPHTVIEPDAVWSPQFEVMDHAATYWYHPHLHHKTEEHVLRGISGMIIVKDEEEGALELPRTYGVDDFPVIIQTRDFDENMEILFHTNSDDVLMVNATIDPYLEVPAQIVRLRLLNGSSQRVFNLGLTDNKAFHQIASDGGLLENPVLLTRLLLAPGERAEILIDFSSMLGNILHLRSYASELPNGIYGATFPGMGQGMVLTGYNPNPMNGANFDILQFDVVTPSPNPVMTIPSALVTLYPLLEINADTTRMFEFMPEFMGPNQLNGHFMINDQMFDMDVINFIVPLNNTEIWTLDNMTAIAHPFHVHMVQFFILDRNGQAPPLNERGRKDVVLVRNMETVRVIAKFENFASEEIPYMYHCHMLMHEDMGMMGQFLVTDQTVGKANMDIMPFKVYPNPSSGKFQLSPDLKKTILSAQVFDLTGNEIQDYSNFKSSENFDLSAFPNGVYFLKVITDQGSYTVKLVKN
jgi:FtsP/CotA-like multicopper oxidase with cupredoxin domain